jgi:hypothetical protein
MRTVRVRALHGLRHHVHRVGGSGTHRRDVVAFEDVQHFDDRNASGADRRHRNHLVAPVRAFHRRPFLRRAALQIAISFCDATMPFGARIGTELAPVVMERAPAAMRATRQRTLVMARIIRPGRCRSRNRGHCFFREEIGLICTYIVG